MPTLAAAGAAAAPADRFGHRQVLRGRDLDVGRLTFDDADGVAGLLGEGRFVGGVARDRQRVAEHVAPERLRRLREEDRPAVERRAHEGTVNLLDRVACGDGRQRRARLGGRRNGSRDQIGARERPRGVVHDDDVGAVGTARNAAATESCRRAPPATTRSGLAVSVR